jgi:hypothetical protein
VREFIASLNPVMFGLLLAMTSALGVAAFVAGIRQLRHAVLVAATPTSALRSAAQGFGEFEGKADLLPGVPIVAPLTGTLCAWYRCQVYEAGEGREQPRLITDETSDGLFLLRDYSGTSLVDPEGAVVTPNSSVTWYTDSLLMGFPPGSPGSPLVGRYRCREQRIDLGARLYVMGRFATHGASQEVPDTPAETRALLKSWKRDPQALLHKFDVNGDGQLDAGEWDEVRKAAAEEVARLQRERFGGATVNLISRPADGRSFIISTLSEEHLLRRWRRQALWAFCGFVAAATLVAWALAVRA